MEIYLAKTQGFCAGVSYAIEIVERVLSAYGPPIYVFHEIVHNTFVVENFKERGVKFVDSLDSVPNGSQIIFSAHGVPPLIVEQARERQLRVVDATCPLVKKVHREAVQYSSLKVPTILIGHPGHQEIIGTAGYVAPGLLHIISRASDIAKLPIAPDTKVAYITQTTLSQDDARDMISRLKQRFFRLIEPPRKDICYATQNRQDAVKELAALCDLILICGSSTSSNSNRLRETGEAAGIESYLLDSAADLDMRVLEGKQKVGISSGASVPRFVVRDLVKKISSVYTNVSIRQFDNPEKDIVFPLPNI